MVYILKTYLFFLSLLVVADCFGKALSASSVPSSSKIPVNFYVTNQTSRTLYVHITNDQPIISSCQAIIINPVAVSAHSNNVAIGNYKFPRHCLPANVTYRIETRISSPNQYDGSISLNDTTTKAYINILSFDPNNSHNNNVQVTTTP